MKTFFWKKQLLFCQSLSVCVFPRRLFDFSLCALSREKTLLFLKWKKLLFFDCSLCFSRSPQKAKSVCVCTRRLFSCVLFFLKWKNVCSFFSTFALVCDKKAALASQKKAKKKQKNSSLFHLFSLLFRRTLFRRVFARFPLLLRLWTLSSALFRLVQRTLVFSLFCNRRRRVFFPPIFSHFRQKWVLCMYTTCALFCGEFRA